MLPLCRATEPGGREIISKAWIQVSVEGPNGTDSFAVRIWFSQEQPNRSGLYEKVLAPIFFVLWEYVWKITNHLASNSFRSLLVHSLKKRVAFASVNSTASGFEGVHIEPNCDLGTMEWLKL